MLELAVVFHHTDANAATSAIGRLHRLTNNDNYAYYTDVAYHIANTINGNPSAAR
ncbi:MULTISPECIES: hypothetical protein [Streptomyces]|uniref:hypothetical protein n=1 Tax=Streptomyces TaxID=1883 RepID=UPI000A5533AA|nr:MULTISPECIES: hypothetical protein [Streptomyces]MDX2922127.1 hypothetical protein [Streptomyces sp. NE06-03C]MDX3610370.1 hypothetical protein [Streptomyces sp. FL06-04B]MDX3739623.1 hypothetical protein [Streptomyces sp. ID01-15D]